MSDEYQTWTNPGRCRRRKQKCDLKNPRCSNCQSAQVECLTFHAGKRADLPRTYVSDLEAEVQRLTRENRTLQRHDRPLLIDDQNSPNTSAVTHEPEAISTPTEGLTTPTAHVSHLQDLVQSVRSVVVESSGLPRFLGPSSGITLAKMVMASVRPDTLPPMARPRKHQPDTGHVQSSAAAAESTLPPRHAANHLVEVYFQYRTPHLPVVQRDQVGKALDNAYLSANSSRPTDRTAQRDTFTTYMILAIALCNVPNPAGGTNRVAQSEGCFKSAIRHVEDIITYSRSNLETLQAVLLLAQFVSMCPWQGSLWHLTGIALRLCIDTGLHSEEEAQVLHADPGLLYERRRLWYSAYHFDRVLGITLGRPFGITDESSRVPLPNPWAVSHASDGVNDHIDVHHQRAHNHLFSMSQLESEIRHVQQSQTWPTKLAYPKPNLAAWTLDIRPRLQEWYDTIPPPQKAHPSSIFANQAYWDAVYQNSILLLYRPQSNVRFLPVEALSKCHEAARKLITSIKTLQRDGKLDVLWKWVHDLLLAGLTVIYGLWQSKEIRDRSPVGSNIAILQSCASTLSAMSETFQGAAACRDIFEILSTATIDWLINNSTNMTDASHVELEKQVEDLMQQLQASRGNAYTNDQSTHDWTTMLHTENFSFGEMLSAAAQWPEGSATGLNAFGHEEAMSTSGLDFFSI